MNEQFYDLKTERLPDGTVRLTQNDYAGNEYIIDAHPAQIIHMARTLVGAKASPEAARIVTLERRLRGLHDRFLECDEMLPSDFLGRCADAGAFYSWLSASLDVATEYCADLTPEDTAEKEGAA